MSTSEANGPVNPVTKPFAEFWQSYAEQWNANAKQFMEGIDGSTSEVWRRKWLDAMSQSFDAYMRSPAFLEAMKHNFDGMIQAKQSVNDVSQEVARNSGIPTAGDISGLFERLHSIEDSIIARLSHIEQRIGAIEESVTEAKKPSRGGKKNSSAETS